MQITKTISANDIDDKSNVISEEDLALINQHTRKEFSADKLYSFNITLCDNEIDRAFERFTVKTLEQLATMFVGKTGIFDHNMKTQNQNARVYKTWIEKSPNEKTSFGEEYTSLKASAYMVRTKKNSSLIDEIEAGIKKEVSVGCSVKEVKCSICGAEMQIHGCEHIKGKKYKSQVCHGVLQSPLDAYEWSFVAVPAQKNAGVTKSYKNKEEVNLQDTIQLIKSANHDLTITKSEIDEICNYINELEKMSREASAYRSELTSDIEKYALIIMPKVNSKEFIIGCKNMSIEQLKAFKDGLKLQASQVVPLTTQIKSNTNKKVADQSAFRI